MASSPMASTPTSAGSPPPLAMKMPVGQSKTSMGQPPLSITSKEWVIPPRPKPGRKPATDTPPTKRKAQNRAAQRAFRERRAARVGELEDCMKEVEEKHVEEKEILRENIAKLEANVERFRSEVMNWRGKCAELEQVLKNEKESRARAETDVVTLQQKASVHAGTAVPLHRKLPTPRQHSTRQSISQDEGNELMGCGNCTEDSRCECVEQALNMSPLANDNTSDLAAKRPHSPECSSSMKRHQRSHQPTSVKPDPAELETDFTGIYSSTGAARPVEDDDTALAVTVSPLPVSERCGFCTNGTPCVCAELESQATAASEENRLAPLLSQFTPPPSEGDVQPSVAPADSKPQPIHPSMHRPVSANPCANGPGTCAQCLSDPNSTIFCKSLAATRSLSTSEGSSTAAGGCCGSGSAANGGTCCRAKPSTQQNVSTLSCAETYSTLSRHPHYSEATDELDTWLGHLRTRVPSEEHKNRAPMEVEAASVMGVLKVFDRRFGRE